jgi:glutathione S-transferase
MRAVELLRPEAVVLTPSYAAHLVEWAAERDFDLRGSSVERVLVAGEPGGGEPGFREQLESGWGARVTEAMGIGDIGVSLWGECEEQDGMHLGARGFVHPELIEPESGQALPLEDGAAGELVLTHLRHRAAPLLRFRTRDHVRIRMSPCPCGRTGPRVRCVGRTDEMLIVRGVNVFPSAVREVVSSFAPRVSGRRRARRRDPRPCARGARRSDRGRARRLGQLAAERVQVETSGALTPTSGRSQMSSTLNILKPSVNNMTVRIFVRAAGIDVEEVDVWGTTTSPEYVEKYPAHLTPMLEEHGLVRGALGESCAIMAYLCNKHGLDRYYPTDPAERAVIDNAMFYLIGTLYPLLTRATYPALGFPQYPGEVGTSEADEAMKDKAVEDATAALADPLEVYGAFFIGDKQFIGGDSPSIADFRFAATLEFLRAIDYEFPAWAEEYMQRMESTLGDAYSEPAADVRGYIEHVRSQG